MIPKLQKSSFINAFAMIVDINGYAKIAASGFDSIAQFARDALSGGISSVERNGGDVVGFMGDAFYALMHNADDVFRACVGIAKDLANQYDYFAESQEIFPFTPKNYGLKIGVEYGELDISNITSDFLGTQQIFTGIPVNYAARILSAGEKNRCLFGPNAKDKGMGEYLHKGPFNVKGKKGEKVYTYYSLDLDDIWEN